jgi:hypothetical protein
MTAVGEVIKFPREPENEQPVTYRQLGQMLNLSKSQLHVLRREGMPSEGLDYAGRRMWLPSRCRDFLEKRQRRLGRER